MFKFRSLKEFDESEGTVTLVDSVHHVKTRGDIVLIPQPSDDPNDPLNWPKYKKIIAFIPILIFTALGNWVIAGLSFALPALIGEFRHSFNATAQGLLGFAVLTLGAGNFFWIPFALWVGKRPAFILAASLFFATIMWSGKADTFKKLVAARILSAFASSSTEGLAAAINADLFFLHERGWWMGIYVLCLNAGPTLGSLMSGFVIQSLGWRAHFWFTGIIAGINLILIILFLPETQYYRKYVTGERQENGKSKGETTETTTDATATPKDAATEGTKEAAPEATSIRKKSYLEELKPFSGLNPDANFIHLLLRPWPLIIYPAVLFAFLIFSTTLAWIVCVIDTAAVVFQSPPYLMSPGTSSLINVPAIIGILFGAYAGGGLTDLIAERLARKHDGVYEPEYRLVALVFPLFLVPVGLLMYGCGIQNQDSWAVGFIGYGFLCFGLSCVPSIVMTYVIDAYYPVAFEALLLINGLKNIFAFGFSYGVVPWVTRSGYSAAFGEMVVIQTGVMLFAIPMYLYGKKLRHLSATWKTEASSTDYQFKTDGKRRYHSSEKSSYPLPNDKKEVVRLDQLQFVCSSYIGTNVLAPIAQEPTDILDVGCGSGAWVAEVGKEFPSTNVFGLDLSPVQRVDTTANCQFRVGDLNDGLPFDDDSMDLVQGRILMSGITKDQWPLFAKDVFRICKPGTGWAQLIETCAFLACDDGSVPKDSPIWEYQKYEHEIWEVEKGLLWTPFHVEEDLKQAGFVDIQIRMVQLKSWAEGINPPPSLAYSN